MGMFGRSHDKEKAMRQAEDIAAGRGLVGKLGRAFVGADGAARMQEGLAAARGSQAAAAAVAAGMPTIMATVAAVADTGQLINFDPVVIITATLADGSPVQVQTLVSKLQIPRHGDTVLLVENPAAPGTLAYVGPSH